MMVMVVDGLRMVVGVVVGEGAHVRNWRNMRHFMV